MAICMTKVDFLPCTKLS